jgi:hypothetical protein
MPLAKQAEKRWLACVHLGAGTLRVSQLPRGSIRLEKSRSAFEGCPKPERFARSTGQEARRTLRGCPKRLARRLGQLFRLLQAAVAAHHLTDFSG